MQTAQSYGIPGANTMFAFYSNRAGCIGSIVISLIGTVILAALMWMLSG